MRLRCWTLMPLLFLLLTCVVTCGRVADDKSVRVIFVQWQQSTGKFLTQGLKDIELTQPEIAILKSQHLGGTFRVVGSQRHGSRDDSNPKRVIIIMQHQIDKPIELRQPNSNGIYLQLKDQWKLLPSETETNDRLIWLEPNQEYRDQTMYWFQLPDGARQGMTAFIW